ncbi:MAG TPA: M23 family metallopeptidase [Sphingomonas sp.]|uniref:M23 family metallopeptidase n=1 Tax=Sphingomonas sp. TaxID=28214 RepID=UPI002EDB6A96
MNRFGKAVMAVLILVVVGLVAMVRVGRAGPDHVPPAPPHADARAGPAGWTVPVAGVAPATLADTFGDARAGHVHGAIDIPAARGTPVIAAAAGTVEKIFESGAGGHTVYVRSPDQRWIGYYAHLDSYAPGLAEGRAVARGAVIGTVGFSGNADPGGPHLHFEVKAMAPDEPWYRGRAVNPYPMLTGR